MEKSSGVVHQLAISNEVPVRRHEHANVHSNGANHKKLAKEALEEARTSRQQAMRADLVSISEGNGVYRIFAQALTSQFSLELGAVSSQPGVKPVNPFEPPSPIEVATTVLGFVASRLQSEADSGASQERITTLMEQARSGVAKGFDLARNDIKSLGLMNDQLEAEIGHSFSLITDGLDNIQAKFLPRDGSPTAQQSDSAEVLASPPVPSAVPPPETENDAVSGGANSVTGSTGIRGSSYTKMESAFSLRTQDGDEIFINFAQVDSLSYKAKTSSERSSLFLQTGQFDGFQIAVKGTLDDGEMKAIGDLLSQVNEVSRLFFEDSFQEAFASALNVGFDASEISTFSLNLSKMQVDEVRVYGNSNSGGATKVRSHSQSLVDMVNKLGETVHSLSKFAFERNDFIRLLTASVDQHAGDRRFPRSAIKEDFSVFTARVIERLIVTEQ